jgi:hypothetical protein
MGVFATVLLLGVCVSALYENAHKKEVNVIDNDAARDKMMAELLRHEYNARVDRCKDYYEPMSRASLCASWSLTEEGQCTMKVDFECLEVSFEEKCHMLLAPYIGDKCVEVRSNAPTQTCDFKELKDCDRLPLVGARNLIGKAASVGKYFLNKLN